MPRVKYTTADIALVARMMRAEAEGEGPMGELMVGNVIVNRLKADCLDFKGLRSVQQVIFQVQGGNYSFEAVQKGNLFYSPARTKEKRLAKQTLDYWVHSPSRWALWYLNPHAPCPTTWFDQPFAGQFKQHCFYLPNECPGVYNG
ncbi:cell wall hydrolase [Pullulanibacillus sp. KACC 23026]|uniref:cell wall hydrolase n=1 Tax=Pullulanibacillus sp. KACC 23026 TaxID=3028315 RepID=UPI0023B00DC5|nr:cell wall hydrolase [Pullulanibacillus sp. KACC 23026]WEG14852.1 cell wall hydrolase [Pullulanibacillus sp. KACC 23026]